MSTTTYQRLLARCRPWLASLALPVAVACGDFSDSTSAGEPMADAGADAVSADGSSVGNGAGTDAGCADCAPVIVAPEIAHPYRLAAAGGSVYWSDFTKDLWTCDPASCIPKVFGADPGQMLKSSIGATSGVVGAIDTTCSSVNDRTAGEYVYPRDGGSVATRGVACPAFVSTRGDRLYMTNSGTIGSTHTDWSVTRCEADGRCVDVVGSTTPLAFGVLLFAVATDTMIIGAMSSGTIAKWNNAVDAGATVTTESLATSFRDLATDGKRLFWRDGSSVRGCEVESCAGTARVIAADATAQVLAADSTGLYWTSKGSGPGDGKVMWLAAGASTAVAIVTGQIAPVGIALDEAFVYWANDADAAGNVTKGSLLRRAKP
jgi:hypothetical protein